MNHVWHKPHLPTPWRKFYIVSRPNPAMLGQYLATVILGFGFLIHGYASSRVTSTLPPALQVVWESTMIFGGIAAFLGAGWRHITHGLYAEAWGAFVCSMGLLTYATSVGEITSWSTPASYIVGVFGLGILGRAWQCKFEYDKLPRLMQRTAVIMKRFEDTMASKGGDIDDTRSV